MTREADRSAGAAIISGLQAVVSPDGIERAEAITIGGIPQFVSVRGQSFRNPVLLVIHGGPGWVSAPISWWISHGWDEYFTVIHWDQRGAGRTYALNDPDAVAPTMTRGRMDADVDEIVCWARQSFEKERIFVLGHSWGSILGLSLAVRRPEWLHAYVGVGQAIEFHESERRGWRWALERARATNNRKAMDELASLAPYAATGRPPSLEALLLQRKWLNQFGGAAHNRRDAGFESAGFRLSPLYSAAQVALIDEAQRYSMHHLLAAIIEVDFRAMHRLEVPVFMFLGRHDHNVSASLAAEWLDALDAPRKQAIWFENSAHEVLAEEPGKVLVTLVGDVFPLCHDGAGSASLHET